MLTLRHFVSPLLTLCLAGALWSAAGTGRLQLRRISPTSGSSRAAGYDRPLATPFLGYVSGSAPNQLRPLLGIPGAARQGSTILLPDAVTRIYLAPEDRYALVEQGPDTSIGIALLTPDRIDLAAADAGVVAVSPLQDAPATAAIAAFSTTGTACALYTAAGRLQLWTGLPDSPRLVSDRSTTEWGITPRLLAVSDDAGALLAADAAGNVSLLPAAGSPVPLYTSSDISTVAFLPNLTDAVVADRTQNTVVLLRQVDGNASVAPLASGDDGIAQPDFAAPTLDGQAILVSSADHTRLWEIPLASGAITSIDLPVSPALLHRLPGGSAFLFSSAKDQPAWILVRQAGSDAAFFVPNEVSSH